MDKIKAQADAEALGIGFTVDGEYVSADRVVMFYAKEGIKVNNKARELVAQLEPSEPSLNAWRTRIGDWFVIAARGEVANELEQSYLAIRDNRSFSKERPRDWKEQLDKNVGL